MNNKYLKKRSELGVTIIGLTITFVVMLIFFIMINEEIKSYPKNRNKEMLTEDITMTTPEYEILRDGSEEETEEIESEFEEIEEQEENITEENEPKEKLLKNELSISEKSGIVEYPNTSKITITKNLSGGNVVAMCLDEDVATVNVTNNRIITITPKALNENKKTKIIITSQETEKYDKKEVIYNLTVKQGKLSVSTEPYEGVYDGKEHGITVSCIQKDAKIKYLNDGEYTDEIPKFIDASSYTVNYKVELEGYKTESGSVTATINKAYNNLILSENSGTITYPKIGNITIEKNLSGGKIFAFSSDESVAKVSVDEDRIISIIPQPVNNTKTIKITIVSEATGNYTDKKVEYDLTVEQGILDVISKSYEGTYDGENHGITVSCEQSGAMITYLKDEKYVEEEPKYADAGIYTINYKVELSGYKEELGTETIVIQKATNNLEISSTVGIIEYPTKGTVTVIKNISGGNIVAELSDNSVATVEVKYNNEIEIVPKAINSTKTAVLAITSEQTNNYAERTIMYELTVEQGTLNVIAESYRGSYDKEEHSVIVSCAEEGARITYLNNGKYTTQKPVFTNVSEYTINYKVELEGYKTESGSLTVTIEKALNDLELSSNSGTIVYPNSGLVTVKNNVSGGNIRAQSSDENVAIVNVSNNNTLTIIPKAINSTKTITITVTSDATENYVEKQVTYDLTVEQGILDITVEPYEGIYNGEEHGVTISCVQDNARITYLNNGEYTEVEPKFTTAAKYTVYYKVELEGYKTEASSATVTINKASNSLILSETSGVITYPNYGKIKVEKNISGGKIYAAASDNSVVILSVNNNNEIIVTPKTIDGTKNIQIAVVSEATENYTEKEVTYDLTINQGTLQVTSKSYEGVYDGQAHGITVSCAQEGAKITYLNNDKYTYDIPTYVNTSTYTVNYKVELEGYKTISGSETITINKAVNDLVLSSTSGTITYPNTGTITIAKNVSGGTITASISDDTIATLNVSNNNMITITPKVINGTKTATITIKSSATENYNENTVTYNLTIKQGTLNVTATPYEGIYDGKEHGVTVSCSQDGAKITYLNDGSYTTTEPKFTNAATYTVSYKVELEGYKTESGSLTVTINQAQSDLVLSQTYGTVSYPNNGAITVTKNVSGGTISASLSDASIATLSVSDNNKITITPKAVSSTKTAIITVKSAATTNYEEKTATYSLTVKLSTYTIVFNGNGSTSGSMSNMSMTYDMEKNLTTNTFVKNDYSFQGWNTKSDGTGTSYSDGQSVNNLTSANGGTVTLYAQWKKNEWIFTENIKEPTCTEKGIDVYTLKGTDITKEVEIPELGHKQASGWSYSSTGHYHCCERCGIQLTNTEAHTSSGNCTVCGFTGTFTVSYNLFKMTASNSTSTATYGSSYTTTLTPVNSLSYKRPDDVSISVGGKTITSGYTYNNVSGTITISNITGNVVITASAVNYTENISFTNAKQMNTGQPESVELMQSYQLRVLAFTPTQAGTYKFYSNDSDATAKTTDPYAYLYSSEQGISLDDLDEKALQYAQTGKTEHITGYLKKDDDSGDGYNFSITQECKAGVTYYLAIRTYSPQKVQSFVNIFVEKQ